MRACLLPLGPESLVLQLQAKILYTELHPYHSFCVGVKLVCHTEGGA
jgi:hypothetical protein